MGESRSQFSAVFNIPSETVRDMLELKALQRDLYLAPQSSGPSPVLLPRVPIPLLRLNP